MVFAEKSYEVRPPNVREAITLLSVAQDALTGDEDAYQLVLQVLLGWYPSPLFVASRVSEPQQVTAYALTVMHQGTPASRKKAQDVAEEGREIDWSEIISLYMHTYGCSLEAVLGEPWAGFLTMANQMARIEARQKLNYLHAKGIPYIKNKGERSKAMQQLQRLAGHEAGPKRISKEEAAKNLDDLAQQFASFGALGRA